MRANASSAIRAQLIAALEQRAANLEGEARRTLDTRLAELRARNADAQDEADATRPEPNPLRGLLAQLAREMPPGRSAYPDVAALAGFRQLWSTLRADSQLQQSIAHTTTDVGPLNSIALASRAIALMQDSSPPYLRSFLAYVDDLAWLEQLGSAGSVAASGTTPGRKKARRKPQV
ncbi:DUF2894 domain-containing protein [Frateuria terrea]|uniref:DUF2894 domain-containing protein n=1 Tax=Frateuria terrea TaxID=529704 RepID=A0A1H6ZCB7_9GAMM|nr:DUF2894 domain-containing protein [Frateuria terrea]SEJ51071.1 Protein of unknown function [Frateuria terrea]SFP79210.1 Protein of unknown function [Frateuria terrea]